MKNDWKKMYYDAERNSVDYLQQIVQLTDQLKEARQNIVNARKALDRKGRKK